MAVVLSPLVFLSLEVFEVEEVEEKEVEEEAEEEEVEEEEVERGVVPHTISVSVFGITYTNHTWPLSSCILHFLSLPLAPPAHTPLPSFTSVPVLVLVLLGKNTFGWKRDWWKVCTRC